MIARIYLTIVGILYAGLAIWCSVAPETTSKKVGLERIGGSGKSEFLTVYGGLEMGLALVLLMPWFNRSFTVPALWSCVLVHGCLVVFRTISYFVFTDLTGLTHRLAIGEWVIFLSALACLVFARNTSS